MGNCCGKQSLKSSPSNSFTNLKFPSQGEGKQVAKSPGGRSRRKSGDSTKGKKNDSPQINTVLSQPQNGVYTGKPTQDKLPQTKHHIKHSDRKQPSPLPQRPDPVGEDGRSSSYRLRQADVVAGTESKAGGRGSNHNSLDRSTPTSQLTTDRSGSMRLEQQLLAGHRRTDSTDLAKRGHTRTGSGSSHAFRDRVDSQKRIPADFIRKGSWTVNEPKLTRGDSNEKEYSPVSAHRTNHSSRVAPPPGPPAPSPPSILVDHCAKQLPRSQASPTPQKSSIPPPTSPSLLTRSDSCKNELNPVLRNKPHLQERRQVVSAITINTALCNGSDSGSNNSSGNRRSTDFSGPVPHSRKPKGLGSNEQSACVLKWKKGNLLGRGTFGKVSILQCHVISVLLCISVIV